MLGAVSLAADETFEARCQTPVVNEFELYRELAKDPHFWNGVPPPGSSMRVERGACGYQVHVGVGSPDALNGQTYITNAQGKVVSIIDRY